MRRRALPASALIATLCASGCYASHERDPDAGRSAPRDAAPVADATLVRPDASRRPDEPCVAERPLIQLDEIATGLGHPACRTIEVWGGDAIECADIAVTPFRIEGVGPGLALRVSVLNDPPLLPRSPYRVALRSFHVETCMCMGGGWAESDITRTHTWRTGTSTLEVGLGNPGALYRVEACATAWPPPEEE